jgi:protein CpxP
MKTNTFLKIALLIMFIINVVLIGFMLLGKPKTPLTAREGSVKEMIANKLNLDEEQREAYFALANQHNKAMMEVNRKARPLVREYFSFLKMEEPNQEIQDSILSSLNQLDRDKVTITYAHFEDVKEICNSDQVVAFEGVMDQLIQQLLGDQKKSPPPPRD